jgi:hypothetical protein
MGNITKQIQEQQKGRTTKAIKKEQNTKTKHKRFNIPPWPTISRVAPKWFMQVVYWSQTHNKLVFALSFFSFFQVCLK